MNTATTSSSSAAGTRTTPELTIRRSSERGVAEHGWLSSRHTFSFAGYVDPRWQGFRNLLVINDDSLEQWAAATPKGQVATPVYSRDWTIKTIDANAAHSPLPPAPAPAPAK